jgi:SDR family mycofactocin-dependent oxidoreductase
MDTVNEGHGGKLVGKVALITGLARGQGRAHAVRLAREGAAVIGLDLCEQLPTVFYPMSGKEDLDQTVAEVEAVGGRILARVGDVRDRDQLAAIYREGVAEFGPVDIVLPNAGIMPTVRSDVPAWHDAIDIMLSGVFNTIDTVVHDMIARGAGGSIIITSSTAGLSGLSKNIEPGSAGYVAAKHGVVGLMRMYAARLAAHSIRVNTLHPTGVDTPMVNNAEFREFSEQNPDLVKGLWNPMPVALIDTTDVSSAVVFLASDEARYITGVTLPIDAGFLIR